MLLSVHAATCGIECCLVKALQFYHVPFESANSRTVEHSAYGAARRQHCLLLGACEGLRISVAQLDRVHRVPDARTDVEEARDFRMAAEPPETTKRIGEGRQYVRLQLLDVLAAAPVETPAYPAEIIVECPAVLVVQKNIGLRVPAPHDVVERAFELDS